MEKIKKTNYNFYCIENQPLYIDPSITQEYRKFLHHQLKIFGAPALKYLSSWENGTIKENKKIEFQLKPILFCEGEIDIDLIKKACELHGRVDILEKIEIRQRGSCNNLDKLWKVLTEDNWETVPQTKILLYDCDTGRKDEDWGHMYRRAIPIIENSPIKRGIENLFSKDTIERAKKEKEAFFDVTHKSGSRRGIKFEETEIAINHQEKRNFCNWIRKNGTLKDFQHFDKVFQIIDELT